MASKQTLSQEQKLTQRLSPLQLQLVPLLQMNRGEIEEEVRREMDDNPALEVSEDPQVEQLDKDEDGEVFDETPEQMQAADYKDEDDIPYYRTSVSNRSADDETPNAVIVSEGSLVDYLMGQMGERELTDKQHLIAEYIIGNIDDNGYLQRKVSAITDDIVFQTGNDVDESEVEEVLQIVRDLDPAGVGATDLRDCLLLQLEREKGDETHLLAYKVIDRYFEPFIKKHYERIIGSLGIDSDTMKRVVDVIRTLNPKPGNTITGIADESHSQQIIPDFNVDVEGDTINLTLLNNIPDLQVSESYSLLYSKYSGKKPASRREEEAAAVYEKRIANLKEYLDFGGEYYTDKEKEYLIAQYQDLDTPLYYEYFDGWSALQQSLPTFLMILALVAGFFLSGMFSEEFQTKADAVFFSTKLGRNKAVRAKIGAGLLVSTVLYVVFTLLYTAIVLFVLGPDGANCPIQLDFWRSSYNITILEGYLMIVAGGYVGMLFTSGMAILVSVLTRSTVIAALVPVFIICFLPFLSRIIPLATVFSFFPDKLFNIYDGLRNFSLTEIGGQVMNISSVILPLYFVVALLLIPLVYRLYRKAEIK